MKETKIDIIQSMTIEHGYTYVCKTSLPVFAYLPKKRERDWGKILFVYIMLKIRTERTDYEGQVMLDMIRNNLIGVDLMKGLVAFQVQWYYTSLSINN